MPKPVVGKKSPWLADTAMPRAFCNMLSRACAYSLTGSFSMAMT